MNYLLDTHIFLWWILDSPLFPQSLQPHFSDASNKLFFSVASGWEIAIKTQLGKLHLPHKKPEIFLTHQLHLNNIEILPIQLQHTLQTLKLPAHHKDPFDRLLIAQAQTEKMPILTADAIFSKYDVKVML